MDATGRRALHVFRGVFLETCSSGKRFHAAHQAFNKHFNIEEGRPMLKLVIATTALALATFAAGAQTSSPSGTEPMTTPATPNSATGVTGQPGHQAGPASKSSTETTGANPGDSSNTTPDAAKKPGLPGGKSGPTVKSPSSTGK
jgi:hypothetical protein